MDYVCSRWICSRRKMHWGTNYLVEARSVAGVSAQLPTSSQIYKNSRIYSRCIHLYRPHSWVNASTIQCYYPALTIDSCGHELRSLEMMNPSTIRSNGKPCANRSRHNFDGNVKSLRDNVSTSLENSEKLLFIVSKFSVNSDDKISIDIVPCNQATYIYSLMSVIIL